jgi:4-amino-4-deoxy-L-arabinose transferase-like glycosyltransferase
MKTVLIETPAAAAHAQTARVSAKQLWPLLVISLIYLWLVPMSTSLGLDESGNWWVVKDGFREMMSRSAIWAGGQSVLFNILVLAARAIGGDSDIAMRIPALLAALATLVLVYRLGLKFGGSAVGVFSCLAFVTMTEVVYVASTVRPYSLGILLTTGAMLALINWMDSGNWRYAALYVGCAALTPYANYLHGSMFGVHAAYILVRMRRRESRASLMQLLCASGICLLLMVPLAVQGMSLYARRSQETYLTTPAIAELLESIAPPILVGSLVLGFLTMLFVGRIKRSASMPVFFAHLRKASAVRALSGTEALLIGLWVVLPPLVLFALSCLTDIKVFAARYYLVNAPAVALGIGVAASAIPSAGIFRAVALSVALCSIVTQGFDRHFMRGVHDFRGAAKALQQRVSNPGTPILFVSGYIESDHAANWADPKISQALIAPLMRYRPPGNIVGLPQRLRVGSDDYMEHLTSQFLADKQEFYLVGLASAEQYRAWLLGRGRQFGFTNTAAATSGGVIVVEFRKTEPKD